MNPQRLHLLEKLKQGFVIITPNNRLSNQILDDYFKYQGQACLDKPLCFSYSAFLQHLFQTLRYQKPHHQYPILLNAHQIRFLWRETIDSTRPLGCNEGLLDAVISAWTRCKNWQIKPDLPEFHITPQTLKFQQWWQRFEHQLQKKQAITEQHLVQYLSEQQLSNNPWTQQIWVCFDDYTPDQIHLQKVLISQGSSIEHHDFNQEIRACYQLKAHEVRDEYQQLIHWLKDKTSKHRKSIGVVIPNLATESTALSRILERHFPKEQINISLGASLAKYPIVAHALQLLKLDLDRLTNHQVRLLVTSPYIISAQQELVTRSQWLVDAPCLEEALIPLSLFTASLKQASPALKQACEQLLPYPQQATISNWIQLFNARLNQLGFPGDGTLDSETYQCLQRFYHLFDEFRTFSVLTKTMTQEKALHTLDNLAHQTIFQSQKNQAQIQVLGLLEASGCSFENLWVSNMTDQCLPQKVNLSAFIPIALQGELNMPHANATRELAYAQKITQRFQRCSQESVFSYAQFIDDKPCMPSPLIANLPLLDLYLSKPQFIHPALLQREEHYQLPMRATEQAVGGTSLLANQAKCPFRAFAAHRLHLKAEITSTEGITAQERGQLIHRILEALWQQLKTQENFFNYPKDQLNHLITTIIENIISTAAQAHPLSFPKLVQSIEIQRLTQLVHACLDWERQRSAFTIQALEQASTIELAGLTFHVKIDRLDQLATGKKWVIDYKSRLPTQKPWDHERPEAPQLLLYALLDDDIQGILFLELRQGKITCCGLSEDGGILGMRPLDKNRSWQDYQSTWRETLTTLALEFQSGHCPPTPTQTSTCTHCEFDTLCRL